MAGFEVITEGIPWVTEKDLINAYGCFIRLVRDIECQLHGFHNVLVRVKGCAELTHKRPECEARSCPWLI